MGSIFLSYAGTDREIASRIYAGLTGAGVDVWWDREGIGWGDNWIVTLEDELRKCSAYIILIGQSGVRKWVKAELYLAIKRHFEQELPIFPVLLPGVTPDTMPPFLEIFQAVTLTSDFTEIDYGALAHRLSGAVDAQESESLPAIPNDICPFPGLEAFGEQDARFFFGRQKETLEAVSRLGLGLDGVYRRWLQVEGTSGVGKSSLVRAGIIPAIKKGWAGSADLGSRLSWRVLEVMRPGSDPILNMSEVLSKGLSHGANSPSIQEVNRMLQDDEKGLQLLLRQWVDQGEALVLAVDQLEEIFTLTLDSNFRERFDALLANALNDQDGPLQLITTIRSDFMMRFSELPKLQDHLTDPSRYFLKPMDENGLKDVVQTPARLARLRWSDDSLPDDIVKEARGEPGALPLVENLLRLLWGNMKNSGANELSRKHYNELGGVGGALAKSADSLLESLGKEKDNALNLLTALVNVGGQTQDTQDTRRTITKSVALRAAGGGDQAEEILNQLSGLRGRDTVRGSPARPRLVITTTANSNGMETGLVDLAHETLLRNNRQNESFWPTLRDEVTKKRKFLENRELVEALAKDWRENGSPRWHGLATRVQCRAFHNLRDLSDEADRYVKASVRLARIRTASVTTIVLITVISLSFLGWISARRITASLGAKLLFARIGIDKLSPEMKVVPAGVFDMGDIQGAGNPFERPVRRGVTIESFAIGRYEVTFEEYDRFAAATGARLPESRWGSGRMPVIDVSWNDARDFAEWLSKQTGKHYRLPSEAEWEYVARGGKDTSYWWGNDLVKNMANCIGCGSKWDGKQTAPVGSFKANSFGLFDTAGNVWEWVEDCWHNNYKGAPSDQRAWKAENGGQCGQRVMRGGSWSYRPGLLRSSNRNWGGADNRYGTVGFRLAQDLD
jgi:formylglycine-generating enzyme required for sulfatase activity